MSRKKFWLTPPWLKEKIFREFGETVDQCPFPLPPNWDAINKDWDDINYVNPPFRSMDGNGYGPTAFAKKAIEEFEKGRNSILVLPTQSYVNLLLEAGAEARSLGRVRWIECNTGEECRNPSPITMFILKKK